jgi:hypothetical protein
VVKEKFGQLSGLGGWPMNTSTCPTSETEKGKSGRLTLDYALEKFEYFRNDGVVSFRIREQCRPKRLGHLGMV